MRTVGEAFSARLNLSAAAPLICISASAAFSSSALISCGTTSPREVSPPPGFVGVGVGGAHQEQLEVVVPRGPEGGAEVCHGGLLGAKPLLE